MGGAGANGVVPGGEHHVLGAAAGVEVVAFGLGDDHEQRGIGDPGAESTEPPERRQALAIADDHEAIRLAVLGAAGHATGLEDSPQRLVGGPGLYRRLIYDGDRHVGERDRRSSMGELLKAYFVPNGSYLMEMAEDGVGGPSVEALQEIGHEIRTSLR